MNFSTPLVSIIIPTYNRVQFLGESIDSVIGQAYLNWECIIVDDGSKDTTQELAQFYCNKDKRIIYLRRPEDQPGGAGSCRNFGYKKSQGEFIMWLDDDLLHQDKIINQVALVAKAFEVLITCAWGRFSNKNDFVPKELKIYKSYKNPLDLLIDYGKYDSFFPCHAFLISRELVKKAGLWSTDLTINDDGEYFSRIINKASSILFAKNTFVKYRSHNNNRISAVNSLNKANDLIRSWKLISENFAGADQKKIQTYLSNGKNHSYTLLKTNGYKIVIFNNFFFFKSPIFKDIRKKLTKKWFVV